MSSAPNASCSRPVCPSAPISAGPFAPARIARSGEQRERQGDQGQQHERAREGDHHQHAERNQRATAVQHAGPPVADENRKGALAGHRVGGDVPQVVDHQQGARQQADRHARRQRQPGHPVHLHVRGPGDGGDPEEDEDGQLAQAPVAVRAAAAGVGPGGGHRGGAQQQQPPGGGGGEREAGHAGGGEAGERGAEHLPRRGESRGHQPDRPDPALVGAADAVAVVVGVIDPHLQGQGDHQGEGRAPQREAAVPEGHPRAHHDRDDRGWQRTWPGTTQPLARRRHQGVSRGSMP